MLIDAHAHIDKYEESLEVALEEIKKYKIFTISTSMDIPSFEKNLKIHEKCEFVFPIFGIHPWNASDYVDRLQDLSPVIENSPIIGEVGLDHHFVEDTSQYEAQLKVFEFFLSSAKKQNKIVNLHTKGAEREILNLLIHYGIQQQIIRVVIDG
ncbi:TatD family hydrolase [Thermodesulfobacteriota bacterium]